MNERTDFEETLLVEALALPADARRAFIENRCAGDARAISRLLALVDGYQESSAFLETPAPAAALQSMGHVFAAVPPEPEPGDRINHYHLLNRIGEGGFGIVYLAEQEQPVQRLVALKVIRLGLDTREFIARFETERQALAVMDHPNIARVFDAGATDGGRPYLVMELIRGIPITAYCDEHKLPVMARLGLFLQVCGAIQHAHQKGIIHCDLKPSNILVEPHDPAEQGCPKVIDFGIAKATPDRRTNQTLLTRFHALIGTPAYTSPEQMELSGLDVDTRSDIYSLGVLLYELLTGHQPFGPGVLENTSLEEMRRVIREVAPPRPSVRVGSLGRAQQEFVAQHRCIEAEKLPVLLRSDLDWIVMRCLEKERTRRYETVNGLAMDLRRHLSCEPVVARPPSRVYQFGKFVRRNRTWVLAGAAVAIAVVAGLTLASVGFAHANLQRRAAESARREAEDLISFMTRDLRPELQRVGRLPLSTQIAERTVRYFAALPPDINSASTERNRAIALEALATVRSVAGNPTAAASLWEEALSARRRAAAAAPDDPLIAVELALTEFVAVAQSHPLVSLQAPGPGSPAIDTRLGVIVDHARRVCQGRRGEAEISQNLAALLAFRSHQLSTNSSRPEEALAVGREAEVLYRDLIARYPEDTGYYTRFTWLLTTISGILAKTGNPDDAIQVAKEALAIADRALEKDPGNTDLRETAASMAMQLSYQLADSEMEKSRAAEAVARERWRVLLQMDPQNFTYRRKFAETHTIEAEFLYAAGRKEGATPVLERFVSLLSPLANTPDDFRALRYSESKLASLAAQFGHYQAAREHLDRVHEWHRKYVAALAPNAARQPRVTIDYCEGVGMALDMMEDWPGLEQQGRALLEAVAEASRLEPHRQDLQGNSGLAGYFIGRALLGKGWPEKAVPVLQKAVKNFEVIDARQFPATVIDGIILMIKIPLAKALIAMGDVTQARGELEMSFAAGERMLGVKPNVYWDWQVGVAETGFLLATLLDRSSPSAPGRRHAVLARAESILAGHGADNPLNVHESQLLAKIKALQMAAE